MKKIKWTKKTAVICGSVGVVLVAAVICAICIFHFSAQKAQKEIPVITGVKANVVVYENESPEAIQAALLDGVTTVGGEPCTVKATVFSKTDGKEVDTLTVGEYEVRYSCDLVDVAVVTSTLTVKSADTTPPTISGATDKNVYVNDTISYRDGVTVTDNVDENVQLNIDSSKVDLTKPGKYELVYSATDSSGNTATVSVTVTVANRPSKQENNTDKEEGTKAPAASTKEKLDVLCTEILQDILSDGMSDRQKAEAIYNRVHRIKYVNTPDDGDWIENAYVGLTTGRGDCENYSAASRALLTKAGIPNYELERYGGTSEHYWEIVYVDGGWYHFDACPTSSKYPIRCFLLTDDEVIAYSNSRTDKPNYYIYNHDTCPYEVVKSRNS